MPLLSSLSCKIVCPLMENYIYIHTYRDTYICMCIYNLSINVTKMVFVETVLTVSDCMISDSLKRSRRFHTITCWCIFQKRSQTVSDGLRLYAYFRFFLVLQCETVETVSDPNDPYNMKRSRRFQHSVFVATIGHQIYIYMNNACL